MTTPAPDKTALPLLDGAIIFVHPPRTGGSTLSRVIDWEYSPREICDIDGRFYYWSLDRIRQWPQARLAKMRVFKGHMPFGLHRSIPQPSTYITMLRDPVDRTISEYYARRYRRSHPIADRDAKRLTFDEYIRQVPYNNPQTKAVSGVEVPFLYHLYSMLPSHRLYSAPCTSETLDRAKANLVRYFRLVGLTDRFDETLALAKILFGWKAPYYTRRRKNLKRPTMQEISSEQRSLIAEHHKYDMELYRFGVSLFSRAVAANAARVSEELGALRRAEDIEKMQSAYYRWGSKCRRYAIRVRCAL
jgi:galactose-3-O-sulfotransferase